MTVIDARLLQKGFLAGAKGLEAKKEWINELNVFPVPDGDTGTNMTLTIMAAAREVAAIENPTVESIARAISTGSLRGARGNSGVILSQLFRGFTKEIMDHDEITTAVLARAFARGTETAYKAVMKPKEGTILTVAKGMAEKAAEIAPKVTDMIGFCTEVIEYGDYVLSQTPEMLPVLKQAGVVDSGGQGLMQVMKGALDGLMGKELDLTMEDSRPAPAASGVRSIQDVDIRYGYCTEYIINLSGGNEEKVERELKAYLEKIGDSIVVVADEGVVKVHVHTEDPGLAIQKALSYGSLSRMKIDNMREEHEEHLLMESGAGDSGKNGAAAPVPGEPRKPAGFIAVSVGDGLGGIFKGIGADYLIEGGQTMNPSTEDMLNAIDQVNADTIYILPNNKNIILAAEQAKSLVKDKKVVVIPSKTVPQGIAAIVNFVPELSAEENTINMLEEMRHVKTGQITYAVRNTMIDEMEIAEGDIMGIGDDGMLAVGSSIADTTMESLSRMVDEESELISIYFGSDVTAADAQLLGDRVMETYPNCEVEIHSGGQPVYYYLLSVE